MTFFIMNSVGDEINIENFQYLTWNCRSIENFLLSNFSYSSINSFKKKKKVLQ